MQAFALQLQFQKNKGLTNPKKRKICRFSTCRFFLSVYGQSCAKNFVLVKIYQKVQFLAISFIFTPMFRQILKGYSQIFLSILKVSLLLLLCALSGIVFVYPLWCFATKLPQTYTLCVTGAAVFLFALWLFFRIRSAGIINSLIFAVKFLIIASTFAGFFLLVLAGKRLLTVFEILLAFLLYGFVSFAFKPLKDKKQDGIDRDDSLSGDENL